MSALSKFGRSITGNKSGPANPFALPQFDYKNPLGATGSYYDELIKAASGRGATDTDYMKILLGDIDTDTAGAVGGLKSDFLDRGLGGPGQISDIEANALGGARTNALKEKNRTRLEFTNTNLDRQAEALKTKAAAGSSMLATILGLNTNAWNAAETRKEAGKSRSWLGNVADKFGSSFGSTFGSNLAGGGGSGDDSGGGMAYLKLLMGG